MQFWKNLTYVAIFGASAFNGIPSKCCKITTNKLLKLVFLRNDSNIGGDESCQFQSVTNSTKQLRRSAARVTTHKRQLDVLCPVRRIRTTSELGCVRTQVLDHHSTYSPSLAKQTMSYQENNSSALMFESFYEEFTISRCS